MKRILAFLVIALVLCGTSDAARVQINRVPATISELIVTGTSTLEPSTTQVINAASDTILADATTIVLNPNADYTMTSTPTIADSSTGQIVLLTCANNEANTVTLQDQGTLANSNLQLLAATRSLTGKKSVFLFFNGTDWEEIGSNELASLNISGLTASKIVLTDGVKTLTSAAFTSALLAGQVSDETGSGFVVFGTQPVFSTDITIGGTGPGTILDVTAAGDTDYWWAVIADGVGDDNDELKIGKGTTLGTTPFFKWTKDGGFQSQNLTDSTTAIQIFDANGGVPVLNIDTVNERGGIGTATPGRKWTITDPSNPQMRLEHTTGTVYTDFQTDGNGDLTITPSGVDTTITGDLVVTSMLTSFDSSTTVTDWVYADVDGDSQYFYRDYADFPESGITGANDLTIGGWVKPDSVSDTHIIASKFLTTGDKRMYRFYISTGELRFTVSSDGTSENQATRETTNASFILGVWCYVAVSYDASDGSCIFYKNGIVLIDDATALKNTIADKDPDFQIGAQQGVFLFDGGLFNISLFDDIRTPAEILASATDPLEDLSGAGNIIGQWMLTEDETVAFIDNTQGDAGRDLIPYDSGDVLYGACGRTPIKVWNSTSPQIRLTEEADPTKLVDFGVDTNGDLTITTSGDEVFIPEDVIIGAGTKADGYVIRAAVEVQTANADVTTLDSFTLEDENVYQLSAMVIGNEDNGDKAGYEIKATVYRDGGGATLLGTVTSAHTQEDDAAWDCTFTVDTNDVRISVTGAAATTIDWSGTFTSINGSN